MKYTLTINSLDKQTIALLNLIKATKNVFLKEETDEFELSDIHKSILDERIENHKNGNSKSLTWNEMKEEIRASK